MSEKLEEPPISPEQQHLGCDRPKILIVDDEIFNLATLQTLIKIRFKLASETVSNGEEAIERVRQRIRLEDGASESPQYRVIFMDCRMPMMDGFEATKAIQKICSVNKTQQPYVVALTADDVHNKQLQRKCMEHGMSECLPKPLSSDLIQELFSKLGLIGTDHSKMKTD